MRKELDDTIVVTHKMGGVQRIIETGLYPASLKVYSVKYDKKWYKKVKGEDQNGTLGMNRVVVYNYSFGSNGFKVQAVEGGLPVSEWIDISVNEIMVD